MAGHIGQQPQRNKPKKTRRVSTASSTNPTAAADDLTNNLAARRQQPSRAVKSSTSTRRSRKLARDGYESDDMDYGSLSLVRSASTSSTSSERAGNVRYTKTGRISKALKGQPVHRCEICDKVRLPTQSCDLTILTRTVLHASGASKVCPRGGQSGDPTAALLKRYVSQAAST